MFHCLHDNCRAFCQLHKVKLNYWNSTAYINRIYAHTQRVRWNKLLDELNCSILRNQFVLKNQCATALFLRFTTEEYIHTHSHCTALQFIGAIVVSFLCVRQPTNFYDCAVYDRAKPLFMHTFYVEFWFFAFRTLSFALWLIFAHLLYLFHAASINLIMIGWKLTRLIFMTIYTRVCVSVCVSVQLSFAWFIHSIAIRRSIE